MLHALLLVTLLSACDWQAADLPSVPRDKTLIVMNGGPYQYSLFNNHNPYVVGSDQGFHFGTLPAVFEPLIMFTVLTGEYENWLAEDWHYNDDFTALNLKLRAGVRWSDGEPFDADDVAFTFGLLNTYAGSMVHRADLPEFLAETQIIDDLNLRLLFKKPAPGFWASTLSTNHGVHILPEHITQLSPRETVLPPQSSKKLTCLWHLFTILRMTFV